ncbi:MAG: metallophosphoesterase [Brevinematales bacterium]|nr:metallophosphoesterase [Brevinematales bacterium]
MRILCVSDVVDKYIYNSDSSGRIKPDLIISCGDLPQDYLEFLMSKFNVPLLFVQGNHDDYQINSIPNIEGTLNLISSSRFDFSSNHDYHKTFAGIEIDRKIVHFNGYTILGFEGCNKYNNGKHQYTQKEMSKRVKSTYWKIMLNKLRNKSYIDIVVTHAPPYGIHDKQDIVHTGFKAFLELMDKFKPKYLLHGHTHIYDNRENRIFDYKGTKVINCYGYYILDI